MAEVYSLPQLGWRHYFQQQLTMEELESYTIARVVGQERGEVQLQTRLGRLLLPHSPSIPAMIVGDWLLLETEGRFVRLLERFSLLSRKAAGSRVTTQLIAANIDSLFIVSSMNQDFNLNRLERYLSLAHESGIEPVILLTKPDLCEDPQSYLKQAEALGPLLQTLAVNSLEVDSVQQLEPWCSTGNTVAFLGSSGVGKSSLINTLLGNQQQHTQGVRNDDDKGRHTTTNRSLHPLASGGVLLDTPGMRELQLTDCEDGVEETFSDIVGLASCCRFSDCRHQSEPGCAVREAITTGTVTERRLKSYTKLMREQALNKATLAEKRAADRKFGRYIRSVINSKRRE
ncbi:MAG: ribosome small subunit-dependent GTPase A [Gammaproteobacteria bacterium]|nr:ribosome small subunit-dependent GTPase A [Gammaproteobacteria bacterium]